MRRVLFVFAACTALAVFATPRPAQASPRGVGLGAGAGVAVPHGGDLSYNPSINWGFYVDIPIVSTFHITPSTLLYNLNPDNADGLAATDVSLNFKFMIPLSFMELFFGVTAGLTSTDDLDVHAGGLAGVSFNLVSNVDIFAQFDYRVQLTRDDNVRYAMAFAGPLFRF